ncbi:MAG: DUF6382 domain-containing protein [Oscillospiraceae bacterium]
MFSIENQGVSTYLVYKIIDGDILDTLGLGMMMNNKIKGIVPILFTQMDEDKYLKYNVTSKVSLSQFFTGSVNKKKLLAIFSSITAAILESEEYMIDANSFIFNLENIFVDVSTREAMLVCLPIANESKQKIDMKAFFKKIMFDTQFDQTESSDYITQILNYLNSNQSFSIYEFNRLVDSISGELQFSNPVVRQPVMQQPQQPVMQKPQQQPPTQSMAQPMAMPQKMATPQPIPMPNLASNANNIPAQSKNVGFAVPSQQNNNAKGNVQMGAGTNPQQMMNKPPQNQAMAGRTNMPQQSQPLQPEQKKMSMFSLMMHYSKENKAIYQEQKNAAKSQVQQPPQPMQPMQPMQQPLPQQNNKKSKKNAPQAQQGFAIPGQSVQNAGASAQAPALAPAQAPAMAMNQRVPQPQQPNVQQIPRPNPQQPFPPQQQMQPMQPMQPMQQMRTPQPVVSTQPADFGETTVLGGEDNSESGETTVLGVSDPTQSKPKPFLIRTKNSERIILDKPLFKIGKEKTYVDYYIGDNKAISRSHANVICREGKCYIMDTNSTNHTFVNGEMIKSNTEIELSQGTKICLADEDFSFNLY